MITPEGFVSVTPEEQLAEIAQIFYNTFGVDPDLTPGNPTSAFIQEIDNMALNNNNSQALLYSNIYNPQNATGVFLDGLCSFTGLQRLPATQTVVKCVITGLSGTIIPINSIVLNQFTGDQFYNNETIYIGVSGVVNDAYFISKKAGVIPAPANSITVIQQAVQGWSTVNNPTDGETGSNVQNDTSLRNTRNYSLALGSVSWFDSLASALTNFVNQNGQTESSTGYKYVLGWYIFENYSNISVDLPGTTDPILPHSVYITVYAPQFLFNSDGSQNLTNAKYLAGTILKVKSAGSQTQNVQTGDLAFSIDYQNPIYNIQTVNIKFDTPTPIAIKFNITVQTFSNTITTTQTKQLIANAVLSQFYNGYGVIPPVSMYQDINALQYIPTIINTVGNVNVESITIEKVVSGTPAQIFTKLPPTEIPTLSYEDVFNNIVIVGA